MLEKLGPFEHDNEYVLTIDGKIIPWLIAKEHDGLWSLIIDRPGAMLFATAYYPEDEIARYVHFIATCMAIAAGYTSFERPVEINPFMSDAMPLDGNIDDYAGEGE